VMPNISERNFIGLALRGNVPSGSGYSWSTSGEQLDALLDDVESLVRNQRRQSHIHSERIYLAGFGSGASAAMELILRKPEWFGGAACLCGSFSQLQIPSFRFRELQNKRVLLAASASNRSTGVRDVVEAGRMLYSSGMQIGTRVYQDSGSSPSTKMLSDVNHWLMNDVCSVMP
jgi:phospholipase/carboxylesterase